MARKPSNGWYCGITSFLAIIVFGIELGTTVDGEGGTVVVNKEGVDGTEGLTSIYDKKEKTCCLGYNG